MGWGVALGFVRSSGSRERPAKGSCCVGLSLGLSCLSRRGAVEMRARCGRDADEMRTRCGRIDFVCGRGTLAAARVTPRVEAGAQIGRAHV